MLASLLWASQHSTVSVPGLRHTSSRGKGVDGASTPSSAPPSPTAAGLRRNLSGSDMAAASATAKAAAFDRKKGGLGGQRKWVRFDRNGETSIIQADKHALVHQLGVQLRDLRLLDPHLNTSYPSALLCRDKALVVNLEHIKCIITKDEVFIVNADEESVVAFIEELQRRLTPKELPPAPGVSQSVPDLAAAVAAAEQREASQAQQSPFELRALEVVLDVVCSHLDRLSADLEAAAHPALDDLTAKVSTANLERVRRIKNRLVRLTTRVETLREVLEKILDDDSDMHQMNLTARAMDLIERQSSLLHTLDRTSLRLQPHGTPHTPKGFDEAAERDEEEIAEVEMVLEGSFLQMDNTYNKLQTLCEYIDDTEDYINIELDSNRNQLIRLEVMLTSATLSVALIGVVSGLFGMNLHNTHEDSYDLFVIVSATSSAGAILVFLLIFAFCKYKKLF
ncbi:hypothetical protein WJX81_006534 [Elliptochloris bilobata]|uniref:Magnesium transporter n=1 Tax=Elliptochloris bilobata TaxID=381761 RepID=A0AAW1SD60_9CHLO